MKWKLKGVYRRYIRIMEKKMETAVSGFPKLVGTVRGLSNQDDGLVSVWGPPILGNYQT